jgi:hypothetical protein
VSSNLIVLTGLIYVYICLESFFKGNTGLGWMYFGYAVANYGAFLIATKYS